MKDEEALDAEDYWKKISSNATSSYTTSSVEEIKDPVLKVLHKMLTLVLFQRTDDSNTVTKKDLWILSMFEENHQHGYANVAWLIATWMKEEGTKSQILCGQLVTKLGRNLGILTNEVIQSFKTTIQMKVSDSKVFGQLINNKERSMDEAVIRKTRMDHLEEHIKKIEGMMMRQSY